MSKSHVTVPRFILTSQFSHFFSVEFTVSWTAEKDELQQFGSNHWKGFVGWIRADLAGCNKIYFLWMCLRWKFLLFIFFNGLFQDYFYRRFGRWVENSKWYYFYSRILILSLESNSYENQLTEIKYGAKVEKRVKAKPPQKLALIAEKVSEWFH